MRKRKDKSFRYFVSCLVPGSLMKDARELDIDLRRPNEDYRLTKIREHFYGTVVGSIESFKFFGWDAATNYLINPNFF